MFRANLAHEGPDYTFFLLYSVFFQVRVSFFCLFVASSSHQRWPVHRYLPRSSSLIPHCWLRPCSLSHCLERVADALTLLHISSLPQQHKRTSGLDSSIHSCSPSKQGNEADLSENDPPLCLWEERGTELRSRLLTFEAGMSETHISNNGTQSASCEISRYQHVAVYWNIPARRDWGYVHSCVSSMNIHEVSIRAFKVPEGH